MNNIVCSYGCVSTTDSQGVGTIQDLPSDELGKILQLLQNQSEDKTMCHTLWEDAFNAKTVKIIWFYFYDSRLKEICRTKEICFTEYLYKQSLEKIKRLYSQYGDIEAHTYILESEP